MTCHTFRDRTAEYWSIYSWMWALHPLKAWNVLCMQRKSDVILDECEWKVYYSLTKLDFFYRWGSFHSYVRVIRAANRITVSDNNIHTMYIHVMPINRKPQHICILDKINNFFQFYKIWNRVVKKPYKNTQ